MKKFIWILSVSLISILNACTIDKSSGTQVFVNPIFNKTLHGYSEQTWNAQLSPNSISESPDDFSAPDAYIEKHSCKLLENEQNHIKFSCNVCSPEILNHDKLYCSPTIIVYQINDDGFIRKYSFDLDRQEPYSIETLKTKP